MKTILAAIFIFCGLQFLSFNVQAKTFTGFKRRPTSVVDTISGPVVRYIETSSAFKIVIGTHPAFYSFPKDQNAAELKIFLDENLKSKKVLKFTYDAGTAEIISIDSGK